MGSLEHAPPYPCCGNLIFHERGNPRCEAYRLDPRKTVCVKTSPSGLTLHFTIAHALVTRIERTDTKLLAIRETLRRLDMRIRPVNPPRTSPAELDALLAEFHGVRG